MPKGTATEEVHPLQGLRALPGGGAEAHHPVGQRAQGRALLCASGDPREMDQQVIGHELPTSELINGLSTGDWWT